MTRFYNNKNDSHFPFFTNASSILGCTGGDHHSRRHASATSTTRGDDIKICKAKTMYKEPKKSTFQFEHCWDMLRHQLKWVVESKKKNQSKRPRIGTAASPSIPDSINLGEDDHSPNTFADLERPIGRKAEKEQLNKRKGIGSTHSTIAKIMEDIKEDQKKMIDKKMEMIDKVYVQEQEKLCITHKKHEVELQKHEMELFK